MCPKNLRRVIKRSMARRLIMSTDRRWDVGRETQSGLDKRARLNQRLDSRSALDVRVIPDAGYYIDLCNTHSTTRHISANWIRLHSTVYTRLMLYKISWEESHSADGPMLAKN